MSKALSQYFKIFFFVFSLLQLFNCAPVLTGPKHTLKNVFHYKVLLILKAPDFLWKDLTTFLCCKMFQNLSTSYVCHENKLENWQKCPKPRVIILPYLFFLKVLFCFCTKTNKKLNLFLLPSRPSQTEKRVKNLKTMLRNTLGYLLDLVIGFILSLIITRLWDLRTRDDLEKDTSLLSFSFLPQC